MGVVTTGLHRFSNVTARSQFGVLQEVVPGATVYVTVTSTGLAATIYSDPGMTIQIPGALITTDTSGFYEYYVPAAYNVTEQITSTGGLNVTISNIVQNGATSSLSGPYSLDPDPDGTTTSFTLSFTPVNPTSGFLFDSGSFIPYGSLPSGGYTISGDTLTWTGVTPPQIGDVLVYFGS